MTSTRRTSDTSHFRIGTFVWTGPALQAGFEQMEGGLALLYLALARTDCAPRCDCETVSPSPQYNSQSSADIAVLFDCVRDQPWTSPRRAEHADLMQPLARRALRSCDLVSPSDPAAQWTGAHKGRRSSYTPTIISSTCSSASSLRSRHPVPFAKRRSARRRP
jgi:hypothetical protein